MSSDKNITWHSTKVDRPYREKMIGQHPATVWLTGLSASGKSTIAFELERRLLEAGRFAYVLDGDNVRHGLCSDLGFSHDDRTENIRRIAEVARLMNDAGLIVISAFISPYRADRDNARKIIGEERFVETYLDTPIQVCEQRGPKGLYRRARAGELPDFTGVSAPYEAPELPQIRIDTGRRSVDLAVDQIIAYLTERRFLSIA